MDYEKKYKEALEKARQLCAYPTTKPFISDLQDLFPELAESEDERIREAIIKYFKKYQALSLGDYNVQDIIAWLEKQGELKPSEGEDREYACQSSEHYTRRELMIYNLGIFDGKRMIEDAIKETEQKLAWSEEDEYRADAIAEIKDEPQKELAETYLTVFDKKFPILPTLRGKQLADYKNFLNKCQQVFGLKYWGIRPLQAKLFEKLSLLWAAWGAEHLKGLGQTDGDADNEKQEWSEENDKYNYNIIIGVLKSQGASATSQDLQYERQINWLKSLRPQNNATDEELAQARKDAYNDALDKIEYHSGEPTFDDGWSAAIWYLKKRNAQPQSTWKPSDEQLEALKNAIHIKPFENPSDSLLWGLYEQLKKLMKE